MKSILPRILVFALFMGTSLLVRAQDKTTVTPIEYLRPMKNSFSVGVRMIGGANVTFSGDLGKSRYGAAEWYTANRYNDGAINSDSNTDTTNGRPKQTSEGSVSASNMLGAVGVDGHFYTILMNGNEPYVVDGKYIMTGDYLGYNAERSRNWSYSGTSQFRSSAGNDIHDQIAMRAYASLGADPGTAVNASDSRNPGVELTMGRVIQRFKRFEWGVTVGLGISEFNAKASQNIAVRLQYLEHIYDIYTTGPDYSATPARGALQDPSITSFPTFATSGSSTGGFDYNSMIPDDPATEDIDESKAAGTRETSSAISNKPVNESDATIRNDGWGTVDGFWQIKGVYYMLRAGPMARIPIGKRFSAYVSAGYMAAHIGSQFRYEESVTFADGTSPISTNRDVNGNIYPSTKNTQKYLGGYYADFNFEWWTSTRTGFYAGVAYERLDAYEQKFNDRTAKVKMDNGLGWRFGIITRF